MSRHLRPLLLATCLPLLAACALLGGGSKKGNTTIYSPLPASTAALADPAWAALPAANWQLGIAKPSAPRMIDSPRIAVRPLPQELQVYRGATWSMPATDLLETAVLDVLEQSGKLAGVARLTSGLHSDYRLVMDIRRFEADYAGQAVPTATIEVSANLIHSQTQKVVASQRFLSRHRAGGTALEQVVPSFALALSEVSTQIAHWSLEHGQADHQQAPTNNNR